MFSQTELTHPDRLAALRSDGLIDGPPDEAFNRPVRLACRLLNGRAAYLKFVDDRWVFFKSAIGPETITKQEKRPVEQSFSAYVVSGARPLIVTDARADPRFRDYDWVRLGFVVAYVGIPLSVDGLTLGALCVVDDRPRNWTDDDLEILTAFGDQLSAQVKLHRQHAEQCRAQAESVRQLRMFRLAMDSAAINSFDWDIRHNHVAWSENLEALLRMSPGSFAGTYEAFEGLVHPDDRANVRAALQRALTGTASHFQCEFRMVRADATVRWVLAHGLIERDAQGNPLRLFGVDIDISERMQEQEELQRANSMLQAVIDRTPTAILVTDAAGQFLLSNDAVARILGGSVSGDASGPVTGYTLHRADGDPCPAENLPLVRALQGHATNDMELCVRRADGSEIAVLAAAAPFRDAIGDVQGAVAAMHDITARRQSERASRARNAQLDLIARVSQLLILSDGSEAEMLTASFDAVAKTVGAEMYFNYRPHDADSLRLCNWGGLTDDERTLFETMRYGELLCGRVAERRQPILVEDIAHTDVEGSEAVRRAGYGAYAGFPLVVGDRLLGTVAFITRTRTHFGEGDVQTIETVCNQVAAMLERKRLISRLRESAAQLDKILDAQTVGVLFWELETGRLRNANDTFLAMTGYSRADLASGTLTWRAFTPPEYHAISEAELATFRASGRLGPYEKEYLCKDGTRKWMLFAGTGHGTDQCVEFCVDITERKAAEKALATAGESFRQLVEQSPFGIYAVDADFRLAMVSAGAQRIFQNVRPLLGRDFEEVLRMLWPEPFVSQALGYFRHTLATGEPYHAPSTVERRVDIAQTEAYDWKIERVTLPDGRPGVVCHFYDLSERQRLESMLRESEQRFALSMEATNDGLWDWDAQTDEVYFSPGYYRILGCQPGSFPATLEAWKARLHPDDLERVLRVNMDCVAGHTDAFSVEYRLRGQAGEWRWVLGRGKCVTRDSDGRALRLIGTHMDITERKAAEQLLRDADRRKDEFLATLAHELRNPLAPIRTSLRVMKLAQGDAEAIERCRAVMERQIGQMTRLVDDLLDLSRISGGKIELHRTRVKLADVVHGAVETSLPLIEAQGHELIVDIPAEPIYIEGDLIRLAQVMTNLLNNAAKYTPRGGRIRMLVAQHGEDVAISVEDNGLGLPPDMLDKVFEMFTQVDQSLERSHDGLGIGLNIVKRLVEKHGGSVIAQSEGPGMGSTFTVRLPVAAAAVDEIHGESAIHRPPPDIRRRILIVDNNIDAAESLAMMFHGLGHDTKTAHDGAQAIVSAESFAPDVMIMDIGMPKLNGYETCRRIRAQPWGQGIVIVACSGWGRGDDKRNAIEAGFDAHFTKPMTPAQLEALLSRRNR